MKQNKTLPILLKNQKILLIGGGPVALQKAQVLFENGIEFKIIAKDLHPEILDTTSDIEQKEFKKSDIKDFKIIIDATGNEKVAKKLLKQKKKKNLLLNFVDIPKLCDFYFMALTKNRPLQIAVSSNGASPTAAQFFRDECERLIPKDITKYLQAKQAERDNGYINVSKTKKELQKSQSKVYLVGCGLGDPELLTIKAYNIIKKVDVILYDHLITDEILALIPKNTKKIYVGKQKDFHSMSQEKINDLIIKYAKKGHQVARLKSGDPFVFGRGSEELLEIAKHNIKAKVISGISSSISGCTSAGIPITARGYASGFSVVSAHLKGNSVNLDWVNLIGKKEHTVVVLMGISRVKEIVQEAKRLKIDLKKPCAIISSASRENQKVITTNIKKLVNDSIDVERPAILVFGEVVTFNKEFIDFF